MASSNSSNYLLERLRGLVMRRWWWRTLGLWLTVGTVSLWALRQEFLSLLQHFTWTALRYGLAYHRLAAIGLGLCVGLTVALLIGESRHILFGLSDSERQRLQRLHHQIEQQGQRHPLWQSLHSRQS
jgi:hypothetical protein